MYTTEETFSKDFMVILRFEIQSPEEMFHHYWVYLMGSKQMTEWTFSQQSQ